MSQAGNTGQGCTFHTFRICFPSVGTGKTA